MIRPDELRGAARESYDMWRRIGLSEQAALDTVIEDGLMPLSDHDRIARSLRKTFRLSEEAAEGAAGGREGGSSSRPVSEASSSWLKPGDNERLIALIEQWQQDLLATGQLCIERGETRELAALREAFGKVLNATPNVLQASWVIRVAEERWPELATRPGSSGIAKCSETSSPAGRRVNE